MPKVHWQQFPGVPPKMGVGKSHVAAKAKQTGAANPGPTTQPERTQIRIVAGPIRMNAIFDLGHGIVRREGGYGGWEEVQIPGETSVTEHVGYETKKFGVPILLGAMDDYQAGVDQEPALLNLLRLGRDPKEQDPPPVFQIYGKAMPSSGGNFICLGFDFDEEGEVAPGGALIRFGLVMHISEYQSPSSRFAKQAKKKKKGGGESANGGTSVPPSTYTVKKGEDLYDIAIKFYGDRSAWKGIADANSIRDPRSVKAGDKIKLPANA